MRHPSWDRHTDFVLLEIADKHGASIYDYKTKQSWDCGQAVCREQFGPDWMHHPGFLEVNEAGDSEPVPDEAWAAARRVFNGEPEWMKEPEGGE